MSVFHLFQDTAPTASIILDRYVLPPSDYVRVTLRSNEPMAGYLLKAVDSVDLASSSPLGRWSIPAHNTCSQYLQCGTDLHTAVTHTSNCSKQSLVTLQWRPSATYKGEVRIFYTVLMDYRTFWTQVAAQAAMVTNITKDQDNTKYEVGVEEKRRKTDYVDFNELYNALSEISIPTIETNLVDMNMNYSYARMESRLGYWDSVNAGCVPQPKIFRLCVHVLIGLFVISLRY
jgi:hypothetical protein